ncbi:hypothetical protein LIER_42736 [Lithospermum erythrorhizon]|uniref:Uncharacterized protein n=1 Tax=Lithospermum erythrorhizon TaxID=34254 RepID=A0AAV3NY71_LITER
MATLSTNNIDYLDNCNERELIVEAYDAIMDHGKDNKLIKICQLLPDGPLHKITMHGSTILHKAAYSKQKKLVSELLDMVFSNKKYQDLITRRDEKACATFLHEMATSDEMVDAAQRVLAREPTMQYELNERGETPLFRSACYGKKDMFHFLHEEMKKDLGNVEQLKEFFKRPRDGSTILHMTVIAEHFGNNI